MSIKTADVCDDFASELQVCAMEFKSYGKNKRFSGPIATVKVFEDNVLVKEALQTYSGRQCSCCRWRRFKKVCVNGRKSRRYRRNP